MPRPSLDQRSSILPFLDPEFSWVRFQDFCLDLLNHLPEVRQAFPLGVEGDAQDGVDHWAEMASGEKWGFQCKRRKRYGPAAVRETIAATTFDAERYVIMLARQATKAAHDEVGRHTGWEVWDARVLSSKVRGLPLEDQRALLDGHFGPGARRAFTGTRGPAPFSRPARFFRHLMNRDVLFHHAWQVVGRGPELEELGAFLRDDAQNIALLSGRGGIGKSKILHAFAQRADADATEFQFRFLEPSTSLAHEDLDELPHVPLVLVVDDAHRELEPTKLLIAARRHRAAPTKLVLSTRPQGKDQLQAELGRAGYGPAEVVSIDVDLLDLEAHIQLAEHVLGANGAAQARQLAQATRDCPLITVVGGRLLAERGVPLGLLERDADFRRLVLDRFHQEALGCVGDFVPPQEARRVLELLAATAPFRPAHAAFLDAAAEVTGLEPDRLRQVVAVLERHGLALRRGATIRITPDVLSDHILSRACVDWNGSGTGFAEKVFQAFWEVAPTHVFRNLAELDWRQRSSGEERSLLERVWAFVEDHLRVSSYTRRGRVVKELLAEVAPYQPDRVLDLLRFVLDEPDAPPDPPEFRRIHVGTHEDATRDIPGVLGRVAVYPDFVPECADLLWRLGRDDSRDTNPFVDHPIRVLERLAEYHPHKPLAVQLHVLEAVESWLNETGAHQHHHSPLRVLAPLLKKSGFMSWSEGPSIRMTPFKVTAGPAILELRLRAISLMAQTLAHSDLEVVLDGVEALGNGLRQADAPFNLDITDEDHRLWVSEQLVILEHLRTLSDKRREPVITDTVSDKLSWYSWYAAMPEVRLMAQRILEGVPTSLEARLLHAMSGRDWTDPVLDEHGQPTGPRRSHEAVVASREELVREFVKRFPSPDDGRTALEGLLMQPRRVHRTLQPGTVLYLLGVVSPRYAARLCEHVIDDPEAPSPKPWPGCCVPSARGTLRRP